MDMTLVQLETLYWIVRLGGFSAAARHLNTSQPAVSARMRQLEASLGGPLFDRAGRGRPLTPRGEVLLREAEQIVGQLARARLRVSDPGLVGGKIRVGAAELVAMEWLPAFVTAINEAYPRLRLELHVDLTLALHERMAAGMLDIALLPGPPSDSALVWVPVGSVPFAWMASPALADGGRLLRPRDLARHPIITLSAQSNLHGVLEEWFATDGAEPLRINVCNSLTVLTEMVAARIGIGYLSVPQTARLRAEARLAVLRTAPSIPDVAYFAVYPRCSLLPLAPPIATLAAQASSFAPPCTAPPGLEADGTAPDRA